MVPRQKDALYFFFLLFTSSFLYGTSSKGCPLFFFLLFTSSLSLWYLKQLHIYIDMYIIEEEALQYSLELEALQTTHT